MIAGRYQAHRNFTKSGIGSRSRGTLFSQQSASVIEDKVRPISVASCRQRCRRAERLTHSLHHPSREGQLSTAQWISGSPFCANTHPVAANLVQWNSEPVADMRCSATASFLPWRPPRASFPVVALIPEAFSHHRFTSASEMTEPLRPPPPRATSHRRTW